MIICGIDPGMSGALAFYDENAEKGDELMVYKMPVFQRNKTHRVDVLELSRILKFEMPDHVFIEQVNAFGMGATGAYNFGWSCGVLEGVVGALHIPFTYVTPMKWKKAMQCPKDKDSARMRASQLLPDYAHNWPLKKDDGKAEAALIALYARGVAK